MMIASLVLASAVQTRAGLGPPDRPILDPFAPQTTLLQIAVTGSAPGATTVRVTSLTGVFQYERVKNNRFESHVQLQANSINTISFVSRFGERLESAPTYLTVRHDRQAPALFIDYPAEGDIIESPPGSIRNLVTTDVTGRVADTLSGFEGLEVFVNGRRASVDAGIGTNGTFFANAVPITPNGLTSIRAVARDILGNQSEATRFVEHQAIPPGSPSMQILSGNGQLGQVRVVLPQPLVVQVTGIDGLPLANMYVTFTVTRSDGFLADNSQDFRRIIQVPTDANGLARATWQLGNDAGCGNNLVEAQSTDILGTVIFCASASPGAPSQVNLGSGNNQSGPVNSTLPMPVQVFVSDGCNGVQGVQVEFAVVQGGGLVNGQAFTTITTGPTGHAQAQWRLGQGGNNRVYAYQPTDLNQVVEFIAVAVPSSPNGTQLSGSIMDNAEQPIGGVECVLQIPGIANLRTTTDVDGLFSFGSIPQAGPARLTVNGHTATTVGGASGVPVPLNSFPSLPVDLTLVPGGANQPFGTIFLPRLNPSNWRTYSTTAETVLTLEGIEGLEMTITPGSMFLDGAPAPTGTQVSINRVNHDNVPMPMPDGAAPSFSWTLQPSGATFDPPIRIQYPNMSGLAPGAATYFLSFDHDTGDFEIVASGHVDDSGLYIFTDDGAGLSKAGWGCNCPPYSVTGSCGSCGL